MTFTEVIKVKNGKFCNLPLHLKRLSATAQHFFGGNIDLSCVAQSTIPAHLCCGIVKCRILYGDRILSIDFTRYNYREISTLTLIQDNEIDYSYKFANRDHIDRLFEQRGDADEILIVKNGAITDTSFTNVVFRHHNGALFTPDSFLLPGTKRQLLLDNGTIGQKQIMIDDISQYREIYLINTMIDIEDQIVANILW